LAIKLIENPIVICADPVVAELGNSQRSVAGEPESFGRIIDPEAQVFLPCKPFLNIYGRAPIIAATGRAATPPGRVRDLWLGRSFERKDIDIGA
jgi:hypothetical protein